MRTTPCLFLLSLTLSLLTPSLAFDWENYDEPSRILPQNPSSFTICQKSECTGPPLSYQQTNPVVQALADGGFFVAWKGKSSLPASANIYGKIYNSNGSSRTSIFSINDHSKPDTTNPALALFPKNNILVAWVVGNSLYGCVMTPDGTKLGSDFIIASNTGSLEQTIALTVLKDGRFAIFYGNSVYVSDDTGTIFKKVNTAQIDRDNYAASPESIIALDSGGFAIFYAYRSAIFGETYDSDAKKVGNTFLIGPNNGHSSKPSAMLLSKNILVIWISDVDPINLSIYGQVLTQDGDYKGAAFKLYSGKSFQPGWLLPVKKKEFAVSWFSTTDGIFYAQQFKDDYTASGVKLTLGSTSVRDSPFLTLLKNDSYVAVSTIQNTADSASRIVAWVFNWPIVLDDDADSSGDNLNKPSVSKDKNPSTEVATTTSSTKSPSNNVGLIVGVSLGCLLLAILLYCFGIRIIRRRRASKLRPQVAPNVVPKLQHENSISMSGNILLPNNNNNTTMAIHEKGPDMGDSVEIQIPIEQQICVLPDNSSVDINALDLSTTNIIIKPNQPDFAPVLGPQDAHDFILDGRLAKPHLKSSYYENRRNNRGLGINVQNDEIMPMADMLQSVHFEPASFKSFMIEAGKFAPPAEMEKEVKLENIEEINLNESSEKKEERKDDEDDSRSKMCIICENEPSTMVFLDCMHVCTCLPCSAKVSSSTNLCPICREKIRDIRKVYVI